MGARKDLLVSYSHLTQEEVEPFCIEWGIGLKYNPVAPGCDKSVDQCPPGSITLYCRHSEFSNLRFGFEVLCRASGYDPTLFSFRRFFRLVKNGDWFTFETSKVDTFLVSSMVTTLGAWKDQPSENVLQGFDHPKHFLVLLGISKLWDKPDRDPVLMRSRHVMSALDFVKSDDTSDVTFTDAEAVVGDVVVVRGSEHRFEDAEYVSVPNVKGFTKTVAPKTLTRRSAQRMLNGARQSTSSDHVDLSDDIENLIVLGKNKSAGKKAMVASFQGSPRKDVEGLSEDEIYVPNWGVKVGDSFKDANVCSDVLANFAPLVFEVPYRRWRVILCSREESLEEEKEGLKASMVQATGDNHWLIEQGFQQVVTYFLHSNEFNSALRDVYTKLLNYRKHSVLVAGFKLHESGQALEKSPLFWPEASEIFKESIHKMERLTYPYVSEVSSFFGKPISVLQELEPAGLNEKVCSKVLDSMSKKCSHSGDSEETFLEDADVSKEASLEGSAVGGDGGQKPKKAKKAKKGKGDGAGALKPCSNV
ncbi:hypothetical protein Hanom_Chr09g00784221 [Helianthus anomalus]